MNCVLLLMLAWSMFPMIVLNLDMHHMQKPVDFHSNGSENGQSFCERW